jgi:hypothetical protein
MNQAVARTVTQEQPPRSVLHDMASRFGMEPGPFELTVRAQCSPAPKKGESFRPLSKEEFAAFLLVARQYDLNPITREIFAYPKRGGGVVPIVSIDGWVNLVNSHPACDGFEFDWVEDEKGRPISCTCIMHRKDRSHPTSVTEYLSECWRDTDPWKMPHRMLRHKALIQCARYAFGFAGIFDEDEGQRIIAATALEAAPAPRPPRPGPAPVFDQEDAERPQEGQGMVIDHEAEPVSGDEADDAASGGGGVDALDLDALAYFDELRDRLAEAPDLETVEEVWTNLDPMARFEGDDGGQDLCLNIKDRRVKQLEEKSK